MENIKERNIKSQTQDILKQVRKGEQKAQFQLYKYYYKPMYKTSLDIVKDKGKAEDLLNETFLKAFDRIETFDTPEDFKKWIEDIMLYQSKNENTEQVSKENNHQIKKEKEESYNPFRNFISRMQSLLKKYK